MSIDKDHANFSSLSIDKKEVTYEDKKQNIDIWIKFKKDNELYIEELSGYKDRFKKKAKKGLPRKVLCEIISHLLNIDEINKSTLISLNPGDLGVLGVGQFDMKKLKSMYESMGFKQLDPNDYKTNATVGIGPKMGTDVKSFMTWCDSKYGGKFLDKWADTPAPKKEIKKEIKKELNKNINKKTNGNSIKMPTVEILNSWPVSYLRTQIAEANEKLGVIKGYSKGMKKAAIIEHMMKHPERFHHIKMAEKKAPAPKAPKKEKGGLSITEGEMAELLLKKAQGTITESDVNALIKKGKAKAAGTKKERKPPSEKQLAARKKFGDAAKARAAAKKAKN